ncbi:MAG: GHKL domain-containing protein [Clostridiales bacterium]|nr:GHKL domain-containing protein [Clostridiales bacterium]
MSIFPLKYSRRRTVLIAAGIAIVFFLSNTLVIAANIIDDSVSTALRLNLYILLILLSGFFFALICLKGYWQQFFVTVLFFKDCVLFVSFLYKSMEENWAALLGNSAFAQFVSRLVGTVMILLSALLCKYMTHPIRTSISNLYWCISALVPVLLLLLWEQPGSYVLRGGSNSGNFALDAAYNAILLAISFSAYALFVQLAREMEKQMELQLTNQSLAFQVRQMDNAQVMLEQTKIARHELKNNYFYLESLLQQGKYEEMQQFLEQVIWPQFERQELVSTGNEFVDMLLSQKVMEARQQDIPIVLDVRLPKELSIPSQLLCSLLFNLLDNAIEASQHTQSPDIFCTMREQKGYLYLEVRNKIDHSVLKENPGFHTTKSDQDSHGIGMRMIRQVVKRCDGSLEIQEKSGYFVVQTLLPLREA